MVEGETVFLNVSFKANFTLTNYMGFKGFTVSIHQDEGNATGKHNTYSYSKAQVIETKTAFSAHYYNYKDCSL